MKTGSRHWLFLVLIVFSALGIGVSAEEFISANDLPASAVIAETDFDGFTIMARSDKGVTIEEIDVAREAADGEVFNARIKLNGSGSAEFRAIRFKTDGAAKVTVYLNSSSKTDTRTLKVVGLDGAAIAELAAPPDDGTIAGIASFEVKAAGVYTLFSIGSGINIYQIIVE